MGGSICSSGEEDGDAEWRAAIDSVAVAATFGKETSCANPSSIQGRVVEEKKNRQNFKHYQIKAQKLLEEIFEKTIEVVPVSPDNLENVSTQVDEGVRLFKNAPSGIIFDHIDELQGPKKKPKLLPGEVLDEKSKKFRKQLQSAVVEGVHIINASKAACQRSMAKLEAREAAAQAAMKKEEARVAALKKIRGEKWLPSVARHLPLNFQK